MYENITHSFDQKFYLKVFIVVNLKQNQWTQDFKVLNRQKCQIKITVYLINLMNK